MGVAFAVLLLLSAGMVSAPRSDVPLTEIGDFYNENASVVLIAQAVGLAATAIFAFFISGLARLIGDARVKVVGLVVAAASVLTAVPLIVMSFQGSDPSPTMVSLTDLTDAILFLAIAVLLGLLATNEIFPMWIRGLSLVGALLTLVRGIFGFFPIFSSLDFIAPLSFVVMVVVLSGWAFRFSSDKPLAV
ncbi:MAG TPA: hypothetical protein VI193_09645 [Acidimicrobiia bacterium]